jgi:hypothetical protein
LVEGKLDAGGAGEGRGEGWGRENAPPPGGQVGEGAVAFTHSGVTYILGYGADFYGIWNRSVPGPPIDRYPRTRDGWARAFNAFAAKEMRFEEVAAPQGVSFSSANELDVGQRTLAVRPEDHVPPDLQRAASLAITGLVLAGMAIAMTAVGGVYIYNRSEGRDWVGLLYLLALPLGLVSLGLLLVARQRIRRSQSPYPAFVYLLALGGIGVLMLLVLLIWRRLPGDKGPYPAASIWVAASLTLALVWSGLWAGSLLFFGFMNSA